MAGMRRFSELLFLAVFLLMAALPVVRDEAPRAEPATVRPNILVIMTDDQTVDDMRALPKARALLGSRGTTFTNSFVSTALCCPSRSTFLTGQYAHNHGVLANAGPRGGYPRLDHSNTLPVWLQAAGYYTAHFGKYLNNYGVDSPEAPPGWSRWFGLIDPTTYRLYGYKVSDDGVPVSYGDSPADYQTDVLAAEAEGMIRSRSGAAKPFFITVAPVSPHAERLGGKQVPPRAAPRHEGAFAGEPLLKSLAFDEADVADKPAHIRRLPRLSTAQTAHIAETHRARLASLLAVDDLVERLMDALEDTGQLGRTVIIFTSDNGFFLGEHRLPDGKYHAYEEAIRVPLIVRGDGFPAGVVIRQLVSNVDLAPTIVALTGARSRRVMDGRSLLPLVQDPQQGVGRVLLVEGFNGARSKPSFAAVRDARYLYVEHATGDKELYDLQTDPHELRSRHAAPALGAVRKRLAAQLAGLHSCAGKSCR